MTSVCDAHTGTLAAHYGRLLEACNVRTADLNERMKVLEQREEDVKHSEMKMTQILTERVAQNPDLMGEVGRLTSIVTEQQRKIKTLEQQLISETGNSSPEQNHETALNERIDTLNTEVAQLKELQEDHQRNKIQEDSEDSAVKSKDALTEKLNELREKNKELSEQLEVHRAKITELIGTNQMLRNNRSDLTDEKKVALEKLDQAQATETAQRIQHNRQQSETQQIHESAIHKLQAELTELTERNEKQTLEFQEKQAEGHGSAQAEKKQITDKYELKLQNLRTEVKENAASLQKCNDKFLDAEKKQKEEMGEKDKQILSLQQELKAAQLEHETDIATAQAEKKKITDAYELTLQNLGKLEIEFKGLQSTNNAEKAALFGVQDEVKKKTEQLQKCRENLLEIEEKWRTAELKPTEAALTQRNKDLEQERFKLQQELKDAENKIKVEECEATIALVREKGCVAEKIREEEAAACEAKIAELKNPSQPNVAPLTPRYKEARNDWYKDLTNAVRQKVGKVGGSYLGNFPVIDKVPAEFAAVIHEILKLQKKLLQNPNKANLYTLRKMGVELLKYFDEKSTLGKVAGWFGPAAPAVPAGYIDSVTWPTRSVATMVRPSKKQRVLGY